MDLLSFWSYVHADDEVDHGRVVQLGKDIVDNYQALTTESLELFLDRDDLHWGDEWRAKVDESLSNVAFFIPVITPRYFTRVECRRELKFFADRTRKLNIRALILPLLYIDVPALDEDDPDDDLVALVKEIQYERWTDLRFAERSSEQYRRAVDKLARELVQRVAAVERVDIVAEVTASASDDGDGEDDGEDPGFLEKMALLEEAMPRWVETLTSIGEEIERIGSIVQDAAQDMSRTDKEGKGFAARLTIARRVANEMSGPVEEIERLGKSYAVDLADIDDGMRDLLQLGGREAIDDETGESRQGFCSFMEVLRQLAEESDEGLGGIEGMVDASRPLDRMSKDMRPVLRRMRASLTALSEARTIIRSWVELGDSLGVDCGAGVDAVSQSGR